MTAATIDQLNKIDSAIMTRLVSKHLQDPGISVQDWQVQPIGGGGTEGMVFRVVGVVAGQPWALVAKHFEHSPEESTIGSWMWNKEIQLFEHGLLGSLPSGVRPPRYFGTSDSETGTWMWTEALEDMVPRRWTHDLYQRTARRLSRFGASYLAGVPLPTQPLLQNNSLRSLWGHENPAIAMFEPGSENCLWEKPIIKTMFDRSHQERILQMVHQRDIFWDANDQLPRAFCHNDCNRRNFFWVSSPRAGEMDLAMIDWEFCGVGALGNDLGTLVGNSGWLHEYDPFQAEEIEAAVWDGYLAGIADEHVDIDSRLIRLGYLISLTAWTSMATPGLVEFMAPDDGTGHTHMFDQPLNELIPGWVHLNEFALGRSDEALYLIKKIGL